MPIEATRRRVGGGIVGVTVKRRDCASGGGILAGLGCGCCAFCFRCFGDCCGCEVGDGGEAVMAEGIFLPGGARLSVEFWGFGLPGFRGRQL